jgi:hypothetical protein
LLQRSEREITAAIALATDVAFPLVEQRAAESSPKRSPDAGRPKAKAIIPRVEQDT